MCWTGQFNCARLRGAHLRQSKNASIVKYLVGRGGSASRAHPTPRNEMGVIGLQPNRCRSNSVRTTRVNAILPGLVRRRRRAGPRSQGQQRGISYAEMERTVFPTPRSRRCDARANSRFRSCSVQPAQERIPVRRISICGDTQSFGIGEGRSRLQGKTGLC